MLLRVFSNAILPVLLLSSLAANVLLTHRVRADEDILSRSHGLVPGDVIPTVNVKLENGSPSQLKWNDASMTVLYYFDPHCSWCLRNGSLLRTVVAHLDTNTKVYAYTATLTGLEEFRRQTNLAVPVITDDHDDLRKLLKLNGTPQTLLVDNRGSVIKNWSGAYTGPVATDVQRFFHASLPPLPERSVLREQ